MEIQLQVDLVFGSLQGSGRISSPISQTRFRRPAPESQVGVGAPRSGSLGAASQFGFSRARGDSKRPVIYSVYKTYMNMCNMMYAYDKNTEIHVYIYIFICRHIRGDRSILV